jgi:shikimate dehydrogenase
MTASVPQRQGASGGIFHRQPLQLGLIGFPISHSLSPALHRAALAAVGLEGKYDLYSVPALPEGQEMLVDLITRVRAGEVYGLNITIPHKQSVLPLVDTLTETAVAIQAINTIYLEGDQVVGENTDAPGFAAALQKAFELAGFQAPGQGTVIILGAGGSARAVVYALDRSGWQINLAARRPQQAIDLLHQVVQPQNREKHTAIGLNAKDIGRCLESRSQMDLIVNTTPLGMSPNIGTNPWPNEVPLPANAFLFDLVYNPRETSLMMLARQSGLAAANGLGMLVEQAARSFECWTGIKAPLVAMYQAVELESF